MESTKVETINDFSIFRALNREIDIEKCYIQFLEQVSDIEQLRINAIGLVRGQRQTREALETELEHTNTLKEELELKELQVQTMRKSLLDLEESIQDLLNYEICHKCNSKHQKVAMFGSRKCINCIELEQDNTLTAEILQRAENLLENHKET